MRCAEKATLAKEEMIKQATNGNLDGVRCIVHRDGTEEYVRDGHGTIMWLGKPEIKYEGEKVKITIPVTGPTSLAPTG
jgi:hypothetical protein